MVEQWVTEIQIRNYEGYISHQGQRPKDSVSDQLQHQCVPYESQYIIQVDVAQLSSLDQWSMEGYCEDL